MAARDPADSAHNRLTSTARPGDEVLVDLPEGWTEPPHYRKGKEADPAAALWYSVCCAEGRLPV